MAGLLGGFGAKVGGLLGSPRVKDAFMMTLASGGNQEEADYLREQMAQKGLNEKLERMRELQMQQAEAQLRAQQEADARKQYTQALLTAGSSQNPALLQDPAFQSQLRMKAAAYGDPAMLQAGGLLAPTPTEPKETSLQSNLRAMGIDPMSAQGREIMMQSMIKPQTAVNVNTGLPKPPAGMTWVDPSRPELGFSNIPGSPQAVEAQKQTEAKSGVTNLVNEIASQFDALHKGGGVASVDNDMTTNLIAAASNSGVGQAAGAMAGTKNQAARQSIEMKRPLLIQMIKNATNMSSQQMNSNVELQTMLNMATNPKYGYEVNKQQLQLIDQLYGSGKYGQSPAGGDMQSLVDKYAN
jgi:hypothetical protein